MPKKRQPPTSPRKQPRQERSTRMVEVILQAAIRVLERDGAAGFNTARVAERAGVSVGSLYQYFPNKESILFRLQQDEWESTSRLLEGIVADTSVEPSRRLRSMLRAFFRSEHEEAALRGALGDAAPLYRDAPEARAHRARGAPLLAALLRDVAPALGARRRAFAAEVLVALMGTMGKHVSETARTRAEVDLWAETMAEMFLAWVSGVAR